MTETENAPKPQPEQNLQSVNNLSLAEACTLCAQDLHRTAKERVVSESAMSQVLFRAGIMLGALDLVIRAINEGSRKANAVGVPAPPAPQPAPQG